MGRGVGDCFQLRDWNGMPRLWSSPSSQHIASLGDSFVRKDFVTAVQVKHLVWALREAGWGEMSEDGPGKWVSVRYSVNTY